MPHVRFLLSHCRHGAPILRAGASSLSQPTSLDELGFETAATAASLLALSGGGKSGNNRNVNLKASPTTASSKLPSSNTSAAVGTSVPLRDTGADGLPLPWAWQKLLAERAKQTGVRRQRAAAAAADGSVSEVSVPISRVSIGAQQFQHMAINHSVSKKNYSGRVSATSLPCLNI